MDASQVSESGYYRYFDPSTKPRGWIIVEIFDGARRGSSEILCKIPGERDPRELAGMDGDFQGPLSSPDLPLRDDR